MNRIAVITLALFAGMRFGEILGLQWENVDFEQRCIRVRHSLSRVDGLKEPKTKAGNRIVPMARPVQIVLSEAAGREDQLTGYVVKSRRGAPITNDYPFRYGLKRLMVAAGLVDAQGSARFSIHALRHACVSLWIEEGLEPFHIMKAIGHSRIATTFDIYGHLLPESDAIRTAISTIGDAFEASVPSAKPIEAPRALPGEYEGLRSRVTELAARGVTPPEIARQIGVHTATVYTWLRQAGVVEPTRSYATTLRQRSLTA